MTWRYPRPPVLDRIPWTGHGVIEASAGTGKTYTLEHLVIELLLTRNASIDQILVVTFTDKATREMRQRVRETIRAILEATEGEPKAATPPARNYWTIDARARERLRRALFAFDGAPISTIHGFCQRLLSEHAFDSGRLFEQEQVAAQDVFNRALRERLRFALVDPGIGPVLEAALEQRTVEQLEADLFPWTRVRAQVRPVFDRRRVLEAIARLPTGAELEGDRGKRLGAALHGRVRGKVLEQLARLGESTALLLQAPAGQATAPPSGTAVLRALWSWAAEPVTKGKNALQYAREHVDKATSKDESLAELRDDLCLLAETAASPFPALVHEWLPQVQAHLEADKGARGQLDFDDMLRLTQSALQGPRGTALLAELRRRYRFALVDEFQDTDEVQWDIFRRIFFDSDRGHALLVIGDPKQAIYGFRGADLQTYRAARQAITESSAPPVVLEDNYRSTEPLIEAYNQIFAAGFFTGHNRYDHPVACGDRSRALVDPKGRAVAPVCLLHLFGTDKLPAKQLRAQHATWIAEEIARLLGESRPLRRRHGSQELTLEPSDIHVLTRNRDEGHAVGAALRRLGLPHGYFKQDGLFQTDEAREVREVLAALAEPSDGARRLRAWLTPFFGVPLADLPACRDLDESHPLVDRLHAWARLAHKRQWARLFRAMTEQSGLGRRELFAKQGERELTNTQHLLEILLEHTHHHHASLVDLLRALDSYRAGRALPPGDSGDVQRLESEKQAVQILTMHKSKGLEAPVVFLFGGLGRSRSRSSTEPRLLHRHGRRLAWLGKPPAEIQRRLDEAEREEDERLLYVAITRAAGRLYLPYLGPPPSGRERPDGHYDQRCDGCYRVVNDRLRTLVAEGALAEQPELFELWERAPQPAVATAGTGPEVLADWQPSTDELDPGPDHSAELAALRARHEGFVLTSYTRLAHGTATRAIATDSPAAPGSTAGDGGRARVWAEERAEPEGVVADHEAEELLGEGLVPAPHTPSNDELPGGANVGVFLHRILQHLPRPDTRDAVDLETWTAMPTVAQVISEQSRRHGIEPHHRAAAERLVWAGLRSPVELEGLTLERGLAAVDRAVAEMRFLYPIPEPIHPAFGIVGPDDPPLTIDRGLVRGEVDLVFEHGGKVWLLDWKSDRLDRFDTLRLDEHVRQSYAIQARLYTLAVLRLLGVSEANGYESRFGGVLYCFLRGMAPDGPANQGIHFDRPSFAEVQSWEQELRGSDAPFGVYLGRSRRWPEGAPDAPSGEVG